MTDRKPQKHYLLTEQQRQALVAWAAEKYREDGCTGWGDLFDGAMEAATELHDNPPTAWPICSEPACKECAHSFTQRLLSTCPSCGTDLLAYWNGEVTAALTDVSVLTTLLSDAWKRVEKAEAALSRHEETEALRASACWGEGRAQIMLAVLAGLESEIKDGD